MFMVLWLPLYLLCCERLSAHLSSFCKFAKRMHHKTQRIAALISYIPLYVPFVWFSKVGPKWDILWGGDLNFFAQLFANDNHRFPTFNKNVYIFQSETNDERVARALGETCARLHLSEEHVCRDITELFRDDVIMALRRSLLSPSEACALIVGSTCGKFDIYSPWNVTLPNVPKPPVTPPTPPKAGSPQSKILFLTDIHWDQVGTSSPACRQEICLCVRVLITLLLLPPTRIMSSAAPPTATSHCVAAKTPAFPPGGTGRRATGEPTASATCP